MPDVRGTILATVKDAMATGEQTTPHEKRSEKTLTSIKDSLKVLVSQSKQSFNRTKEKMQLKIQTDIRGFLAEIKKNTKPDGKGMGVLKFLMFMFAGALMGVVKIFKEAVTEFAAFVIRFRKVLGRWARGLWTAFKRSKLGRFLAGIRTRLVTWVKKVIVPIRRLGSSIAMLYKRIRWSTRVALFFEMFNKFLGWVKAVGITVGKTLKFLNPLKGYFVIFKKAFGFVGKIFGFVGKVVGKVVEFFKKAKNIGAIIGKFFSGFGKIGPALLKAGGVLGKGLKVIPVIGQIIMVVMGIIDGIIGFFSAGKYFDKAKGEAITAGERVSAIIGSILSGLTFGLLGDAKKWAHMIKDAGSWVVNAMKVSWDWITTAFTNVKDFFTATIQWLMKVPETISNAWTSATQAVGDFFESMKQWAFDTVINLFDLVKLSFMNTVRDYIDLGKTALEFVSGIITNVLDAIKNAFITNIKFNVGVGEAIIGWMRNLGSHIWGFIKNLFSNSPQDEMKDEVLTSIYDWVKGLGKAIWGTIKGFFTDPIGFVKKLVKGGRNILRDVSGSAKVDTSQQSIEQDEQKRTKAQIKEIQNIKDSGGVVIEEQATENEKTKLFMDFLMNQFADTMAKKIAVATKNGDVASIATPTVKII